MNKFELKIEEELHIAHTKRLLKNYDFEAETITYVKPEKYRVYTPDFMVTKKNGAVFYIETKGFFRPEARTKMIHVKRCNPFIDIRFIFMKDLMINKRTKFTYSKWCQRHGYEYAFETIPKEWLL